MRTQMWIKWIAVIALFSTLVSCTAAGAPAIDIADSWGRLSPSTPTAGAFYMTIKNTGDAPDTLLSGTSPACGSIEVHEMVMKSDGTMGMNLIDEPLVIPAGGEVLLKVGGLHVMCIMKKDDQFFVGSTVDLTLKFEKSGEITVSADIRAE